MAQKSAIDLSAGFVKPKKTDAIDLSAGFVAAGPPKPFGPKQSPQDIVRADLLNKAEKAGIRSSWSPGSEPSNEEITKQLKINTGAVPRVAQGIMTGLSSGFGFGDTGDVVGAAKGLWDTANAPPQPGYETWLNRAGAGHVLPIIRAGKGMAEGIYHNLTEGIPEAISGTKEYLSTGDTEQLGRAVHGATKTVATVAPLIPAGRAAVGMGVRALETPKEGLREFGARTVRRGPAQVERARTATADRATKVTEENAATTTGAQLKNESEFSAARAKHAEAIKALEAENAEGQAAYDAALAEYENQAKAVQEANAAEQGQVAKRETFNQQADQHSLALTTGIRETPIVVAENVKKMYPKVAGEADAPSLAANIEADASAAMMESGPVPADIQRVVKQFTPKETEGVPDVFGESVEPGSDFATKLREQGIPGFEEGGSGAPAARATFENLHSQYSALGRAMSRPGVSGFAYKAYTVARGHLLDAMQTLAKAQGEGTFKQFKDAQKEWGRMETTFYDSNSPVAKALAKIDDVYRSLPDDPAGAQQAAAPYVKQILSEVKAHGYARKLLSQFKDAGAPVEALDAMRKALDEADKLPKKAKAAKEPKPPKPFVPKPAPVLELPVPANVGKLKPPPKPFNREEFVRSGVQQTAENLQATTGLSAAYRHPIGRILERPGVKNFITKDPPAPLRPQPGQSGAQGASTPFQSPPSAAPAPPGAPTGGANPRGGIAMDVEINGKPMNVRYMGATEGPEGFNHHVEINGQNVMVPEADFKVQGSGPEPPPSLKDRGAAAYREGAAGGRRASERRFNPDEAQPPAGTAERRSGIRRAMEGPISPADEVLSRQIAIGSRSPISMSGHLDRLGIKIGADELNVEKGGTSLHSELSNIFEELGNRRLTASQIRDIKTTLAGRRIKKPYEIATELRRQLKLDKGE